MKERLLYKSRRWAHKKAAKLGRWTFDEHRGGYLVREMTEREKRESQQLAAIEEIELRAFAKEIPNLLNQSNSLYRRICAR